MKTTRMRIWNHAIGVVGAALVLNAGCVFGSGATYLDLAKAYADAMIKDGRDTYGSVHSPLFASTLDRRTMKIGNFKTPRGVKGTHRNLNGADPQDELGLYKLLYDLTKVTGEAKYAAEADKTLEWYYKNTQSPGTGLYPWGEHMSWNFEKEAASGVRHEANFPWPYWDHAYRVAPENAWKYAVGLSYTITINSKGVLGFSRHANYQQHEAWTDTEFPRIAGQFLFTFMDAYGRPENKNRPERKRLLDMTEKVLTNFETKLKNCGFIPHHGDENGIAPKWGKGSPWPAQSLELARCAWQAAQSAPEPLKTRLQNFALAAEKTFFEKTDRNFVEHRVFSGGGFHTGPQLKGIGGSWTAVWSGYNHASVIMGPMIKRYHQTKEQKPEIAARYMKMFKAVAETYMKSEPDPKQDLKPGTFATVIHFLCQMHTETKDERYLARADHFARMGISLFLDLTSPLPKASSEIDHYENKTGGQDFMHALLCLHQKGLRPSLNLSAP